MRWKVVDFLLGWVLKLVICVAMLISVYLCWQSLWQLPRAYDTLEQRGVRVMAQPYAREGGRRDYVIVKFEFAGKQREERVFENLDQFRYGGGAFLEQVPVLVDPRDPGTAFTVDDVRERTNSGISWQLAIGAGIFIFSGVYLVRHLRWEREFDALMRREDFDPPQSFDSPPRPTSPMDAFDELDEVTRLGRRLPGTDELKVSRDVMRRAVSELRDVIEEPHHKRRAPEISALLDRLEALLREGDDRPMTTTATLDAATLTDLLSALRRAVQDSDEPAAVEPSPVTVSAHDGGGEQLEQRRRRDEAWLASGRRWRRMLVVAWVLGGFALFIGIGLATDSGGGGKHHYSDQPRSSLRAITRNYPVLTSPAPRRRIAKLGPAATAARCRLKRLSIEGTARSPDSGDGARIDRADGPRRQQWDDVRYRSNPPTSGNHSFVWTHDGNYAGMVPLHPETYVHSLERGRVVVQYKPGTPGRTIRRLQNVLLEHTPTEAGVDGVDGAFAVLLENNTGMPYAVAATAWGKLLGCPAVNDRVYDAIRAFRTRYTLSAARARGIVVPAHETPE